MGDPRPTHIQVTYEPHKVVELDIFVLARCTKCKKMLRITDTLGVAENVSIEVEPHNCTE